jgi:hypothetical protein
MSDDGDPELSSPACAMQAADDVYMGFASKAELIAQLNELLAAERAGTKVALKSQNDGAAPEIVDFLKHLGRDEASCCAMLARHVTALGGEATAETGSFHTSAMAIADINARLAFVNRGQGWVVRRITEMLPRVRNDALHADLQDMLKTHRDNIAATNALLAARGYQPPPKR